MERIKEIIKDSINLKSEVLNDDCIIREITLVKNEIVKSFREGGSVYWCGNGGSAADCQHLAAEFSGRYYFDRPPLSSEALHCNTSYLTAVGNDYGYDYVYSRLIDAVGKRGDVLVGISTSGNSPNVVLALQKAREKGLITVAFTGFGGGKMKDYADYIFAIPSKDTPRVQECHILIGHIICELTETELFSQYSNKK